VGRQGFAQDRRLEVEIPWRWVSCQSRISEGKAERYLVTNPLPTPYAVNKTKNEKPLACHPFSVQVVEVVEAALRTFPQAVVHLTHV
jgi:hypothetical protein